MKIWMKMIKKIEKMKKNKPKFKGSRLKLTLAMLSNQSLFQQQYILPRLDDETRCSNGAISHGLVSKIIPSLPILGINSELKGIMVNKGRIHRELRYFRDIFWRLIN